VPQSRSRRCREEQNLWPNRELNTDSSVVQHGVYTDDYCRLGCAVMQTGRGLPTFRKKVLPPSSWYKYCTLKMGTACLCETSVNFYQTTRRHIIEINFYSHGHENRSSHIATILTELSRPTLI
jgi:hypothetical protein